MNIETVAPVDLVEAGHEHASNGKLSDAHELYARALERDLTARQPLAFLLALGPVDANHDDWLAYARALDLFDWPRFSAVGARLVSHDSGTLIECSDVGVVLETFMTDRLTFEAFPDARFRDLPLAMVLLIMRRALWPSHCERGVSAHRTRVEYRGHTRWLTVRAPWWAR